MNTLPYALFIIGFFKILADSKMNYTGLFVSLACFSARFSSGSSPLCFSSYACPLQYVGEVKLSNSDKICNDKSLRMIRIEDNIIYVLSFKKRRVN